jgi:hypothetical protein
LTVFHKIVVLKAPDPEDPYGALRKELRKNPGIDLIPLYHTDALNQITVQLVCSDNNPSQPRTMKDIQNILMRFEVVKELKDHRNAPTKHVNHLLQISTEKTKPKTKKKGRKSKGAIIGETKEVERG